MSKIQNCEKKIKIYTFFNVKCYKKENPEKNTKKEKNET
jgi:hypothetical protein